MAFAASAGALKYSVANAIDQIEMQFFMLTPGVADHSSGTSPIPGRKAKRVIPPVQGGHFVAPRQAQQSCRDQAFAFGRKPNSRIALHFSTLDLTWSLTLSIRRLGVISVLALSATS